MFALSKTLDPAVDYAELAPELEVVDRYFETARPQNSHRRWEYSLALRAWQQYRDQVAADAWLSYDVGGAGSPFVTMVRSEGIHVCHIIDPDGGAPLDVAIRRHPPLADAVFCLSVLEHIPADQYAQFLYHLTCLLAPGGLLVLTFDFWDQGEKDTAHFHWMRERIFTPTSRELLRAKLSDYQLEVLGELDRQYYGPQLYGSYTFASLVMVKRA